MGCQMGSYMVHLKDIHWESGHLVHKQGVRSDILVDAQIRLDKASLVYLHWGGIILRRNK